MFKMNRLMAFVGCACLSLHALAQEEKVMVLNYHDGNSKVVHVEDVRDIAFLSAEESPEGNVPADIVRGMELYYTFDGGTADDQLNKCHGFLNGGTFVYDTPAESGRALLLKENQSLTIGSAVLDGKSKYSVSMWIKDFGPGYLLKTKKGNSLTGPSLGITENLQLRYTTGYSQYSGSNKTFSPNLSDYQIGQWVMLTIVTEVASAYDVTSTLYINGRRVDAVSSDAAESRGGTAIVIGGTAMKIDNLRLYSTALTDDEVETIYTIERQPAKLTFTPSALGFSQETAELSFTITNNSAKLIPFRASDDLGILRLTPSEGYLPAHGSQTITVSVYDRDEVASFLNGNVTVLADGMRYVVGVQVKKGKNAVAAGPEVSRGLCVYLPFDDETADNAVSASYGGSCTGGTFIGDTPTGEGRALQLDSKEYVTIPGAPVDGRSAYTVSLWVKDFGAGQLFRTSQPYSSSSYQYTGPTLLVTEALRLRYYTGSATYSGNNVLFDADMTSYQVGRWTMLTVVTKVASAYDVVSTLYINGRRVDSAVSDATNAQGGISMEIGGDRVTTGSAGQWSDPMKVDNVRLYNVALTADEVAEIYAAESR